MILGALSRIHADGTEGWARLLKPKGRDGEPQAIVPRVSRAGLSVRPMSLFNHWRAHQIPLMKT